MNLIIRSDQGDLLYGHQLLKRIIDTEPSNQIEVCEGIEPEVFFAYVGTKFPENRAVMALLGSEKRLKATYLRQSPIVLS